MSFTFAVKLVDDFGAADGEKVRLGLLRDGAGDQGLAASGRSIEKYSLRRFNPQERDPFDRRTSDPARLDMLIESRPGVLADTSGGFQDFTPPVN